MLPIFGSDTLLKRTMETKKRKQNEDVDESIEDAAAFSRSERTDDAAQQQCQNAAGKAHQ